MIRSRLSAPLGDQGLGKRALRGTLLTVAGFGGGQFLRLLSNLLLTRLLAPEMFGLMALVQVVLTAVEMFSDTGINMSIMQNPRGDEPRFLNTAWSVQILRGALLWLIVLLAAPAVAAFYGQPGLTGPLQLAGATALLNGLQSTRVASVSRHMILGRLTALELGSQIATIAVTVLLALWLESVWALVIGSLTGPLLRSALSYVVLPGQPNRLDWDRDSLRDLLHFGKFIFLGSILGFLINNGDRAILGRFIELPTLGIYSIGFFLATVPLVLSRQLGNRVLVPLYRSLPPEAGAANRAKLRKARLLTSGLLMALSLLLSLLGKPMVALLYDARYHAAGSLVVLLSLAMLPAIWISAYNCHLLARGNSRDFTLLLAVMAVVQTTLLYLGVKHFGVIGAVTAPLLASLVCYPLTVRLVRHDRVWDPALDAGFLAASGAAAALSLWVSPDAVGTVLAGL